MSRRLGLSRWIALPLLAVALLQAAAPRIVIFAGPLLKRPIALDQWDQTVRFLKVTPLESRIEVDPNTLKERPYVEINLYWGPEWIKYMDQGGSAERLSSGQANHHGRFYPAIGSSPAIFEFDEYLGRVRLVPSIARYRSLSDDALEMLTELGIPTRVNR